MESYTALKPHFSTPPAIYRQIDQSNKLPKYSKFQSLSSPTSIKCEMDGIKSNSPSKKMFILGMGYVGQFFAQQLQLEGWDVSGTCTSIAKKKELEQKGLDAHVFNACQPKWEILDELKCCTHLLVSIPPAENVGDPVLQHENYLQARVLGGDLKWLCYLSSTSIYGDSEGVWVDEDYLPQPSSCLAKMRLSAEEGWLKLGQALGLSTYVFRLAGIYGPGRSAIDTILKGQLSERQKRRATRSFTSRVHVADICRALRASMSMRVQRKIYNIVDDNPANRAEVFDFAYQLIDMKWPGLINPDDVSLPQTSPTGGQKRVSNAHMKKELGVRLLHSSYRSGLKSIIDHMTDPLPLLFGEL